MSPTSLRVHFNALATFILLIFLGILATKRILQREEINTINTINTINNSINISNARNGRIVPEAPTRNRLNGIVFRNDHFAQNIGPGRYSGFSIEVLDQISHLTNLTFKLTGHKGRLGPQTDFMIGPLSDVTPHPELSFSEPLFADDNLVAVVSRAKAKSLCLCSIHDLLPLSKLIKPPLEIWSLQGVNHLLELKRHAGICPLIPRFLDYIWEHMYLSRDYDDSMNRVLRGEIALLTSLRRAQKMVEEYDCEQLLILRDEFKMALRNVVIYLKKGSPFLGQINEAIRKMKESGRMQKLVSKNWPEARGECRDLEYCDTPRVIKR